jgi:protein phosphatase
VSPQPTTRKKTSRSPTRNVARREPVIRQRLTVRAHGLTDRGGVRPTNQDQFLIAVLARALRVQQTSLPQEKMRYGDERGHLFVVADGVSGEQAGEEASALAVDWIERFTLNTLSWCFGLPSMAGQGVLAEFREALRQADAAICREAARHPALRGMCTTLTMAYSYHAHLFIAHVGDSRCYLFRAGTLYQLTNDHTLAEEMTERSALPAGAAKESPLRHMITNAMGGPGPGVRPELHKLLLEAGDVLLLCSDGLTGMVPDKAIAAILRKEAEPARACKRLVALAKARGGLDNVTAIVARYEAPAPRTGKGTAGPEGETPTGSEKP